MTEKQIKLDRLRLILVACLFFVMGVIAGWAIHAGVVPSTDDRSHRHTETAQTRQVAALQSEVAQAEVELGAGRDNPQTRGHLGNLNFDIGVACDMNGDSSAAQAAFAAAIQHYEKARLMGASSLDLITDLGTMYYRAHRPQDAVRVYEEVVGSDPRHQNAWMNLGVVRREALGDLSGAKQAWEQYLALNPTGPEADRVRVWLGELTRTSTIR